MRRVRPDIDISERGDRNHVPIRIVAVVAAALSLLPATAAAARETGSLIGSNAFHRVAEGETLLEIARLYDLGFIELVTANPGIDPWLPGVGRTILLPREHLLPDAPREGIVINLPELRLYHFTGDAVETYPIGVGRLGRETPLGTTRITSKRRNPTWVPPDSIRVERPDLPVAVPPGPDNPLGLFAMNLGWPHYVIHGTNKPYGIGRRVSSGCIRLYPEDIERLFDRVEIGAPVTVVDQPVKLGWSDGELYLEIHPDVLEGDELEEKGWYVRQPLPGLQDRVLEAAGVHRGRVDWSAVHNAEEAKRGIPVRITR